MFRHISSVVVRMLITCTDLATLGEIARISILQISKRNALKYQESFVHFNP